MGYHRPFLNIKSDQIGPEFVTTRQAEILMLFSEGHTASVIADRLGVTKEAISQSVNRARYHLQAKNIVHAVCLYIQYISGN